MEPSTDRGAPDRGRPAQLWQALSEVGAEDHRMLLAYLCGADPQAVRAACRTLAVVTGAQPALRPAAES
jgi:hypothetical protein